jgi:hypothetical protein
MRYLLSQLAMRLLATSPSTDRPALPAFQVPAAFLNEVSEDQFSFTTSPEWDVDDEVEGTSFDLPEGWQNDATDAAFVKGAALLRGEVGIDELTEVRELREPPLVRVEPARHATPGSTGFRWPLGAVTAAFQPRLAVAFSVVAIGGVAIVLSHLTATTDKHPGIAKTEPEQQRPAPEQAIAAPRSQGTRVGTVQPSAPFYPSAVQESGSAQGTEAAAAPTLQRVSIASPAPGPASRNVGVLSMQRQVAAADKEGTSLTVVTVLPAQVPEAQPVVSRTNIAPAGALPLTASPPATEDLLSFLPVLFVQSLVETLRQGASDPAQQTGPAADPLAAMRAQAAACDSSDAACSTDAVVRAAVAREQLEQVMTTASAELAAANAALAACRASDAACLGAALPRAIKANEQFGWKLFIAQTKLVADLESVERSNAQIRERARLAIALRQLAADAATHTRNGGRALGEDRAEFVMNSNAITTSREHRLMGVTAKVARITPLALEPEAPSACFASPGATDASICGGKETQKGLGVR